MKLKYALNENYNFGKGFVEESSSNLYNDSGLVITPESSEDEKRIQQFIQASGYQAEFDEESGCFIFPEDEETYDALEKELDHEFTKRGINATFEGI